MNDNINKHIKSWKEYIIKAAKALEDGNTVLYESLMNSANEEYEAYKRETELTYECKNFGMSNYIFEDALPKLFKNNKKAVREFIKTIKEDKNLLSQFQFYKALEKNNENINTKEYVIEALELANNNINSKTINESNRKLYNIIKKYNIRPNDFIPEDDMKLFESCQYLFKNKKNINNILEVNSNIDSVSDYTRKKYNNLNENKSSYFKLIEDFENKYKNLLNEEERNFVKDIMDFKENGNNLKKEKLFNKFKNECINTINKLITEASEEDIDGLNAIKEQINDKIYCKETLVKDMAKLLEIRDILLDY